MHPYPFWLATSWFCPAGCVHRVLSGMLRCSSGARKRQTGTVFPEGEGAPPEEASGGDAREGGERDGLAPGARAS